MSACRWLVATIALFVLFAPPPAHADPSGHALHIHLVSVVDTQMKAGEAFTLLAPVDWKTDGGIVWDTANLASPAALKLRVISPAGDQQVGFWPALSFYWSQNPQVQQAYPKGSKFMGSLVEPTITDCKAALTRAWQFNHDKIAGAKVIDFHDLPDYAKAYESSLPKGTGVQYTLKAGRLRMSYADPKTGAAMEEDFIGLLLVMPNAAIQSDSWMMDDLISYTAPAGQLDQAEKNMEFISASLHLNLKWFVGYTRAVDVLTNMAATDSAAAMQRAQIEFAVQDQATAAEQDAFTKRQRDVAKSSQAWDAIIRGVATYTAPDGTKIEVPAGDTHVWTDGNGNYVASGSAGDAPGGNWTAVNLNGG